MLKAETMIATLLLQLLFFQVMAAVAIALIALYLMQQELNAYPPRDKRRSRPRL
jgi:ABC-type maltose transport system permease subunit